MVSERGRKDERVVHVVGIVHDVGRIDDGVDLHTGLPVCSCTQSVLLQGALNVPGGQCVGNVVVVDGSVVVVDGNVVGESKEHDGTDGNSRERVT